MNKPKKSEVVPGVLFNHVTMGEVMVNYMPKGGMVNVEGFDPYGNPVWRDVRVSDLRWQ